MTDPCRTGSSISNSSFDLLDLQKTEITYTQGWSKKVLVFDANFEPSPVYCPMTLTISPDSSIVQVENGTLTVY